jgi:putative spermidine/putrescine transport system ATP-binding protein
MRDLSLVKVTKKFGGLTAVSGVELTLDGGKMVSFLGPSGCGKTTLLRLIAGLEVPTKGRIRLGENDITDTPAHRRNIGMVFQSLALFPHLSVGENITYGLRIRGGDSATRARRAEELLELVRLPGVAERHISQLSGGQRQRVAIARALALSPELFLLDEPLSALDANLREAMQIELRQLQQRLGVTTIVVTHDQSEAMTMSDLVVVMSNAEVPANRFVADFIGTSNLLPVRALGNRSVEFAGRTFRVGSDLVGAGAGAEAGGAAVMLARPEDVHVLADRQEGENRIAGSVDFIRDLGATVEIIVDCAGQKVISMMTPKDRPSVEVGGAVTVEFPAAACVLLGA